MPKIPRTSPTVESRLAPMPNLAGDGWTAPGRAMQGLGQAIKGLGSAFEGMAAQAEKESEYADNLKIQKWNNELDLNEIKYRETYQGDGSNYEQERNLYFDSTVGPLKEQLSPRGQQRADLIVERKRGSYIEGAARYGGGVRQQSYLSNAETGITSEIAKLDATKSGEEFEAALPSTLVGITSMIESYPGPEQQKRSLRSAAAGMLAQRITKFLPEGERAARLGLLIGGWEPRDGKHSVETELYQRLAPQLPALRAQDEAAVGRMVGDFGKRAAEGYLPTPDEIAVVQRKIGRLGNEKLQQQLDAALIGAQQTQQLKTLPPQAVQQVGQRMRAELAAKQASGQGVTEPERAAADYVEKLHGTMVSQLKENPIGWAVKSGVLPEQVPITAQTFRVDVLKARADAVDAVAQTFGNEFRRYFLPEERATIEALMKRGGKPLLTALAIMQRAFGERMPAAIEEVAKGAPEAARVGFLVAQGGDIQAATDIARTIERRNDPNYRPRKPPAREVDVAIDDVVGSAFRNFPLAERDALSRAVEAIYEARVPVSKAEGFTSKDAAMLRDAAHLALGGRVEGDVRYGGVVSQQPGMFNGVFGYSGDEIVLPPTVKSDQWRDAFRAVTEKDLAEVGQTMPRDATTGRPVNLSNLLAGGNARLEQVGYGRFAVAVRDERTGGMNFLWEGPPSMRTPGRGIEPGDPESGAVAEPRKPFVIDMTKLAPVIAKRRPELFLLSGPSR